MMGQTLLRIERLVASTLILALALSTFWIIRLSPMNGEDYALSTASTGRSFADAAATAIERSANQIANWNARLGEQLAIFGLAMPEWAQHIAMAAVIAIFLYLCARLAKGRQPDLCLVACALALSFAALPRMELFFWKLINFAYLAPLCLFLILVALLRRSRHSNLVAIAIISFLCGVSFENLPPAMGVFIVVSFISGTTRTREMTLRHVTAASFLFAGWATLMLAPSTAHRSAYYRELFGTVPSLPYYASRLLDVFQSFISASWLLVAISAACAAFLILARRWDATLTAMVLAAVASIAIVAASPYTEQRAFAFAWATAIIISLRASADRPAYFLFATCALAALPAFAMLRAYGDFRNQYEARHLSLLRQSEQRACEQFNVTPINVVVDKRLLTLREDYVSENIKHMRRHYGC